MWSFRGLYNKISTLLTKTSTFPKTATKTSMIVHNFASNTSTIRKIATKSNAIHKLAAKTNTSRYHDNLRYKQCRNVLVFTAIKWIALVFDANQWDALVFAANAEIDVRNWIVVVLVRGLYVVLLEIIWIYSLKNYWDRTKNILYI